MSSNRKIVIRLLGAWFAVLALVAAYLVSYQSTLADRRVYSGTENHVISTEAGSKMTANFQKVASGNDIIAGYLGRQIFEKILEQKECVGIRIYNAKFDDGTPTFVLVGVDGNGNDIASGVVGEEIAPCPPWCGAAGSKLFLNGNEVVMKK